MRSWNIKSRYRQRIRII